MNRVLISVRSTVDAHACVSTGRNFSGTFCNSFVFVVAIPYCSKFSRFPFSSVNVINRAAGKEVVSITVDPSPHHKCNPKPCKTNLALAYNCPWLLSSKVISCFFLKALFASYFTYFRSFTQEKT